MVGASTSALAFPPAPHHTLYGLVRNQWGDPITVAPSDVLLETPSGVQLRTSMAIGLEPGVNYRLQVPMDSGTAPDLSTDLRSWGPVQFRIASEGAQAALRDNYQAVDVRRLRVEVPFQLGATNRYFRAIVR